jgi:tetratricopeptide (TPR) repeat protein
MTKARQALPRSLLLGLALALGAISSELAAAKDAKQEAPDQVDHVALAARLIKDGHYERAAKALAEVDTRSPEVDLARYHALLGLVHLHQKLYVQARDDFTRAIKAGQGDALLHFYVAQAHYGLKDHKATLAALDRAKGTTEGIEGAYLMRARCHWELSQPGHALAALESGHRRFPGDPEFQRLRVFYLVDLGLFQDAARAGDAYLARSETTADDYIAIGEALRKAKALKRAQVVLEGARLRFPDNEKILVQLAHAYLDDEHELTAAMLFERAAYQDSRFALEAAELYLRAGRLERALAINARVFDQKAKMKQRLSILLRLERYELVAGMEQQLSRVGLLSDESVRYALAYALFKNGDLGGAERHLKHVARADLFESTLQLRRAMETCRQAGWECS